MSEDAVRPRPVVDPDLPPTRREEVLREADPPPALPGPGGVEAAAGLVRVREGGVQLLGVGFTTALALLTAGWYLGMVIVSVSLVAYVAVLACRRDAHPAARTAGALVGAGTVACAPVWVSGAVSLAPGTPWALFGLLAAVVAAGALTPRVRRPAGERYREHVVLPEDLSEGDHGLLLEVQRTIGLVEAARGRVGAEALDTDRALSVLRDQEWRIASLLARQRELRRAHLRRWQRAASPRVREALKPQREHLHAVDRAVRARVAQITGYGRLVEEAVAAHLEWEQCQEAVDSTAEYTDHLASASFLAPRSEEVSELAATAELARRARDERVERVLAVGGRLAASAEPDRSPHGVPAPPAADGPPPPDGRGDRLRA